MKNRFIIVILLNILLLPLFSQSDQDLLQKYWNYRERFNDEFIYQTFNNCTGCNIPAIRKEYFSDGRKNFTWGDANATMGDYIGMLATEYRLLKNNGQDYYSTLHELYYAIKVLGRLDLSAEEDYGGTPDLNGAWHQESVKRYPLPNF